MGEGKGSHAAVSEACEEGSGRLYSVVTDAAVVACSWRTFSSDPLAAAVMIVENF